MEPIHHMRADSSELYSVQFSPLDKHILSTAGKDKLIKLWDIRNLSESLIEHREENDIQQLKWSN
jgi:WD40 repeat protein